MTQLLILYDNPQQPQSMATFFIETDRPHYTLGQTITGQVLLQVPATITHTQGLRLTFSASQHSKWQERHQPSLGKQQGTPHSERKLNDEASERGMQDQEVSECRSQIYREYPTRTTTIKEENGTVERHENKEEIVHAESELLPAGFVKAGQYSFPFSIGTRKQWPSTFHTISRDKAERVTYLLQVALLPLTVRHQLRQTLQLTLLEASHQHNFRYADNVTSFLCLDRGQAKYEVALDKRAYRHGQQGEIVVSVDNSECWADVEGFTLGVVNVSRDGEGKGRKEVVERTVRLEVRGGEKEVKSARGHFDIPPQDSASKLRGAPSELTLQLQIRHGGTCRQNTTHQIPTILPNNYRPSRPQSMQQSWQPTPMKPTTLVASLHPQSFNNN